MNEYEVSIPVYGWITLVIDADDNEGAKKKAKETLYELLSKGQLDFDDFDDKMVYILNGHEFEVKER